jgi:hypothetical protein
VTTDLDLAARHRYRLPNGEIAVNVTAVSGALDLGRSAAMAAAAARITREGRDFRTEWNAKRDAGTRVHAVCESWLRKEGAEVRSEDAGFVDALEKFWTDYEPQMVECEAIVLSTHGFGGRFDMVADLSDGKRWLIDLKSGKQYPLEHSLQLSAYRYADGIAEYETGMLARLRPVPEVDACACLYIRQDGTYALVEYPADRSTFEQFLSLLAVVRWATSDDMKALEKAAKEAA